MNIPKIGDHIVVRCNNGAMPEHHLNKIYPVIDTIEDFPPYVAGSVEDSLPRQTVVQFSPSEGETFYTSEWVIVPKPGDRVTAITVPGASSYNGHSCTVNRVSATADLVLINGEFRSIQKPDDTVNLGFSEWTPEDAVEPKPSEETGIITDLQDQVLRLNEDIASVQNECDEMRRQRDKWRDDFHTLANSLLEEAENRGWCDEYEAFCERVDSDLRIGEMPKREREYEVSWVATVIVQVPMSRTYTARNEDDAMEMARGDYNSSPETQEVIDAVRGGNWEEQDDAYIEYETEEA